MESEILNIIFSRRSIRKYTEQKVPREALIDLLKAAMAAPTACNNQPWEFVAVDDEGVMDQLRAGLRHGKYNAPAAIIVCHNPKIGKNPDCDQFWVQDCSAAVENILIAATGMGLGTVWLGVYPKPDTIEMVRRIAALPEEVTPLAVLYVGYPAEQKEPRTQYEERRVHWNRYQQH